MGWWNAAGLPGPSTPLEEGLESRFSSIYYFFSLFFFFFLLVIKTKKKNPKKTRDEARAGPRRQTMGMEGGEGGAADRQGMGASHYIHKELTGVAHGHSEGLSTGCQFGGHRCQVTARRCPGGPHG